MKDERDQEQKLDCTKPEPQKQDKSLIKRSCLALWKKIMYHDGNQFNEILDKSHSACIVNGRDSLRTSKSNLLLTLRFIILVSTFFLAIQQFLFSWEEEWSSINTIYLVYSIMLVVFVVGLSYSIYFDKIEVVEPLFILLWVRTTLPLLDFENRHSKDDDLQNINSYTNFGITQNGM